MNIIDVINSKNKYHLKWLFLKDKLSVWWYRFKCWITGKPVVWIDSNEYNLMKDYYKGIDPFVITSKIGDVRTIELKD